MEDMVERKRRGETRDFYRVPSKGVTANSKRIAEAVDDEEWQKVRHSMKGISTERKLHRLKAYYEEKFGMFHATQQADKREDVEIRVDNYIKALCRGGQLHGGESLKTALAANWDLRIKK